MRHARKNWLAAALALVMALTLLPANALAAFGQTRETGTRHQAGSAQELKEALTAAQPGDVIALTGDITVTNEDAGLPRNEAVVTVPGGVTLDGGGFSIIAAESWSKELANSIVGATSGQVVIRDLTIVGNENTKHGVNIYSAPEAEGEARTSVELEDVTIENSGNAGLVVANSVVTAAGLTTRGNAWGAVNVDLGVPSFTMTDSRLEEDVQIWTETADAEIEAEGLDLVVKGVGDGTLKGYTYITDDVSKLGEAYDEENKTVYTALEEAVKAPEVRGLRLVRDVTVGSGQSITIPETVTLTIGDGVTLTVENGGTLTNDGEIVVEDGGQLDGDIDGDDEAVKHRYTVRFDANGGENVASQTVESGAEIELPQAVREGYDFLGWELNDETYAAGEKYTVTSSVTFTAQWQESDEDGDNGDEEWENPYADVAANQWFYAAVQYVSENNLMNGVAENAFGPDIHTTRGMLVTILHRMEGEPQAGEHSFTDVAEDKYYADAVAWAAENDIVNGYSDTVFAPEKAMSREEMAVVLYRYAQYKGWDVSAQGDLSRYADSESVSAWSTEAMTWAVGAKVMDGMDGRLAPQGDALRSQTATVLMRVSTLAGN
ncbi:MAG TPA: S-layer homology domain-containing protein [Candidatus Pelethomonas intestinigallinarum]|nr:S-layer homology domain-containing protein [Candidatus Pelethomonas intestinigallinarum]